jgi:hypothetical protein
VRTEETAYAPPANPAKIRVGFSGESVHPPWARAGIAAIIANARAVRRKVFFIGRSYFRRDPGALGCKAMIVVRPKRFLLQASLQDEQVYIFHKDIGDARATSTILGAKPVL